MRKRIEVKKGERFGRLVILEEINEEISGANKFRKFACECDCGGRKEVRLNSLRIGATKSCGCLNAEESTKRGTTHGRSKTKIYDIWATMLQRCFYKNSKSYKNYGGRGIKVCKNWLKFENFYNDMGDRPEGRSLDRIDNNGNYEYKNCRWATKKEQDDNKRTTIFVSINKVKISFNDLVEFFGLTRGSLHNRIFIRNWDLGKALTTKIKK